MSETLETKCPECEMPNTVSTSELFNARASGKNALMVCYICGRASMIRNLADLPDAKTIKFVDWVPLVKMMAGTGSWIECLPFTGPERYLPGGAYVGPGDWGSPRIWLYSTANLDKSPDGTQWWKWEDFVRFMGKDPFHMLSVMRGENWVKFMTHGIDPHTRTRLVLL